MRRALPLLAMLMTLLSCSPDDAGESTTSSAPTTSTTAPPLTTTSPPATTTTAPATTTSTAVSTTSTVLLQGTWADQPLVTVAYGALGWWDGSTWVLAEETGELPVVGGEDYQVAVLGGTSRTTGGSQTLLCEPLQNPGVVLEDESLLGDVLGPYGVAISAPWELQPHLIQTFDDDGTYAAIASSLLEERGLQVPAPNMKQLVRTDLEGDGTNEILAVAQDLKGGYEPTTGAYSIIFVQKVINGQVETLVLGDTAITEPEESFVISYTVGVLADLSGDGKMEIVINTAYYEGVGMQVWEYVDDDIGVIPALQTGCGT